VTANLEALLTALYVVVDDHMVPSGPPGPGRPKKLSDSELVCLAVAQVLPGARSEHHWLRLCCARLGHLVSSQFKMSLVRPDHRDEAPRHGSIGWIRQWIESVNDTLKGQLDLERHGGHTPAGVLARVLQRILALTAAIWHNDHTGQPVMRSLIAYDCY
jgi:hypothetical protein